MQQYNRLYVRIQELLLHEWDPIGVHDEPLAQYEYDSYIPGIIGQLQRDADVPELAEHLHSLETKEMGLPGNWEHNEIVAEQLRTAFTRITAAPVTLLPNYARVRLTTNRYSDDGVAHGAIGYIIEVYDDAYEVEFSAPDGTTIAQIVVNRDEVERAE